MKFWKIKFDEGLEGFGYLQFNEAMEEIGIFAEDGTPITVSIGYHPVEFDVTPYWA